MIPRRVRQAVLLAVLGHALFVLIAEYRLSYDAFTHMFFADHYARGWFTLWEPRWFGGFEVQSYPPLVHQVIALLSALFGIDGAYAVVQWIVGAAYPIAIYFFARIFVGRSVSSYAAIAGALSTAVFYSAYTFGQLPTLTATLLALFTLAAFADFLRSANAASAALCIGLATVTIASHHATILFLLMAGFAVFLHIVLNDRVRTAALVGRAALVIAPAIICGFIVIWPFWIWGWHQQLQTPIDHLSRHNFFADPAAFVAFFIPMYGPLVILIPFAAWIGPRRRYFPLAALLALLFVLGLGGTTPLPHVLFGAAWQWLTYDRFALWAALMLLPFFGVAMISLRRAMPARLSVWLELSRTARLSEPFRFKSRVRVRQVVWDCTLAVLAGSAVVLGMIPTILHTQPPQVDMHPIADFLKSKDHIQWRFQTFGFGDQMEYVSRLTSAQTIDGSYFTARTLPVLRSSGLGTIDTAFWSNLGLAGLDPIFAQADDLGIRWGFVLRNDYVARLQKHGWNYLYTMSNGVQVWENPRAKLPIATEPPREIPFAAFSLGIFPMLAFALTLGLAVGRLRDDADIILRSVHAIAIGLLPLACAFWYFLPAENFSHTGVYFTYDSALFFIGDAAALAAVIAWLAARITSRTIARGGPSASLLVFAAFCAWMSLSALWAIDWRTAFYIAAHFWLVLGLAASLRYWPQNWKAAALALCAFICLEALFSTLEFLTRTTAVLTPLAMNWPGNLTALTHAASVLHFLNGDAFLRAYGSLPHPNILGGFLVIAGLGPIALTLGKRSGWTSDLLLGLGAVALALSFSRAAWIGALVLLGLLIIKLPGVLRARIMKTLLAATVGFAVVILPLRELLFTRTLEATSIGEKSSIDERIWLAQQALEYFRQQPLHGIGMGSFVIELARRGGLPDFAEPVHNVPVLVATELGAVGFILLLAFAVISSRRFVFTQKPGAILAGAALAAVAVISLFDHYFWTLAPGRLMLGLVIGLWEGQARTNVE